jgi:hypothetical protein
MRTSNSASAKQAAKKVGFVSGYRFSDTVSLSKPDAPLGAAGRKCNQTWNRTL